MVERKILATPNETTPRNPVIFNPDLCNGCNSCMEICQMDCFIPNPEPGKPPLMLYPDECWYGGCCVAVCPQEGAIKLNHPIQQRARWKRKTTGEHFRV